MYNMGGFIIKKLPQKYEKLVHLIRVRLVIVPYQCTFGKTHATYSLLHLISVHLEKYTHQPQPEFGCLLRLPTS